MSEKQCVICNIIKPIEMFMQDRRTVSGYGQKCLDCSSLKLCRGCYIYKPLVEYTTNPRAADGHRYRCKSCENEKLRIKYKRDPEYRARRLKANWNFSYGKTTVLGRRERMLWRFYKMTLDDYNSMFLLQDSRCKVCKIHVKDMNREWFDIDHDHSCCPSDISCGKCIRGLLCSNCNRGLGYFKDDPQLLKAAFDYLSGPMYAHYSALEQGY